MIFSNHMALEKFSEPIKKIKENNYDTIINFSNDLISTNIISFLNFKKKIQVKGISLIKRKTLYSAQLGYSF